jgi:hypothetical protein
MQVWLKVALWLAPSIVAYVSIFGIYDFGIHRGAVWLVFNFISLVFIACIHARVTSTVLIEPDHGLSRVIIFFVVQLLLIPILGGAIFLARCAI